MGDRPLCYLDVDGVLNVFGYSGPDYDDCCVSIAASDDGYAYNCVVPDYVARNVARLGEHFEIVWCTAWRGAAHPSWRRLLNLPDDSWEYVDYRDMKLPELLRHAGDRRWVYLDDEAAWEVGTLLGKTPVDDADLEWPTGRVFPVDARRGLDDELTEQVIEWANPTST